MYIVIRHILHGILIINSISCLENFSVYVIYNEHWFGPKNICIIDYCLFNANVSISICHSLGGCSGINLYMFSYIIHSYYYLVTLSVYFCSSIIRNQFLCNILCCFFVRPSGQNCTNKATKFMSVAEVIRFWIINSANSGSEKEDIDLQKF